MMENQQNPNQQKNKKRTQRTCIACRRMLDKRELCRVVRTPSGEIVLDDTGKMAGRGAYLCRDAACLKKALKSRGLERALKQAISEELKTELQEKLLEKTDDGQEARHGD